MVFKFEFLTDEEKEDILIQNKDKYLISIECLIDGNFLVFSDSPTVEILQQEQAKKIDILETGLKSVLAGDMQSLAYILYPDDFINN